MQVQAEQSWRADLGRLIEEAVPGRRGLEAAPLTNYKDSLGKLVRFVGPCVALEQVTRRHVAAYLDEQN
ncbi:MAG: hypothetical protein E6J53_01440 [Chloroflexi bacterium]|nr:MAG: hypothetical protein E6J53_01440 [Chloroflexota bacterium]